MPTQVDFVDAIADDPTIEPEQKIRWLREAAKERMERVAIAKDVLIHTYHCITGSRYGEAVAPSRQVLARAIAVCEGGVDATYRTPHYPTPRDVRLPFQAVTYGRSHDEAWGGC